MSVQAYFVGVATIACVASVGRLALALLDYRKRYRKRRTS